jgi:hypothetical protein
MNERVVGKVRFIATWCACFSQLPSVLRDLDSWVRRRLRCVAWHQWRTGHRRFAELRTRNVSRTWRPKPPAARTVRGELASVRP